MKATGLTKETITSTNLPDRGFPQFAPGDTIIVNQRITEEAEEGKEAKERIQAFKGDVLAIRKNGIASTFTVRKIGAHSVAIERIFPFYSELIDSIELVRTGAVRRAKLFYIRDRVGKSAQIKEKRAITDSKTKTAKKSSKAKAAATATE